jgi:hypothetical protein
VDQCFPYMEASNLVACADPYDIDDMYRKDKNGDEHSLRGTSQNENWNGRLGGVMNGSNNSPELAQCLLTLTIGRGNMDATARLEGGTDNYRCYSLPRMQSVNAQAVLAGYAPPYPNLPTIHPKVKEANPVVPLPKFGYTWDKSRSDYKAAPPVVASRVFEQSILGTDSGLWFLLTAYVFTISLPSQLYVVCRRTWLHAAVACCRGSQLPPTSTSSCRYATLLSKLHLLVH